MGYQYYELKKMDQNNKISYSKLSKELGTLTENILKQVPPYNSIPVKPEVANFQYLKYLTYKDEFDKQFSQEIFEYIIAASKWNFKDRFEEIHESFYDKYPKYKQVEKRFYDWMLNKGILPQKPPKDYYKHPTIKNINKEIKTIFSDIKKDFEFDKDLSTSNELVFSKKWLKNNKILIMIDKGTYRKSLDFFIGSQIPFAYINIAEFFGDVQCKYMYLKYVDIKKIIEDAIELIDKLMPYYTGIVDRINGEFQVQAT